MNTLETLPVTLDDVLKAQELLEGIITKTPVESSRALGSLVGGNVFFKCENLQRAGSFKVRGAYVRMARLTDEEKKRGVVAASAGNHAQGVAVAAKSLGINARIYMPLGVALPKLAATRSHGAEVILHGHNVDEALAEAQRYANETGAVFVHPPSTTWTLLQDRAPSGSKSWTRSPPTWTPFSWELAAAGCWPVWLSRSRPGPRSSAVRSGSLACRQKTPPLPAIFGCRCIGAAEEGHHHG